jgi:ABC-type dipeptide/oligopeptide/nickel transport system permease component
MGLRTYIIRRILLTIPTLLLLLTLIFLITRVLPGDPVALHFEKKATPEQMDQMRRQLGLDKSLWAQYIDYLGGLVDINYFLEYGYPNLGKSMQTFEEVGGQIFSALPATLELAIYSMIIASIVGILLGVASSKSYNSVPDHLIRGFGTVAYAIPIFFLGIVFQLIFGVYLHNLSEPAFWKLPLSCLVIICCWFRGFGHLHCYTENKTRKIQVKSSFCFSGSFHGKLVCLCLCIMVLDEYRRTACVNWFVHNR